MATLVVRLAGPLQSWGVQPRLRVVDSHSTPTWSGLLGACRAALGHGREADLGDVSWLRELTMAVRVDQSGVARSDYHTVNPLPGDYGRFGLTGTKLGLVTKGDGKAWVVDNKPPAFPTRRFYLHDAAFVWLTEGQTDSIQRLADALVAPQWTIALGRKSCPPSSPFLLGISETSLEATARAVPVVKRDELDMYWENEPDGTSKRTSRPHRAVDLVWLSGGRVAGARAFGVPIMDNPWGSHPQAGYSSNQHSSTRIEAPVGDLEHLLAWSKEHLAHPGRVLERQL